MRLKTLPHTEEEEEALLYFIIIYNLASTHYPTQPLSFSFPNLMAAHGVGVAQAKPACKHTIATRKCYQYDIQLHGGRHRHKPVDPWLPHNIYLSGRQTN